MEDMKYRTIYSILAAALALWTSCSEQGDSVGNSKPVPIRLSTNVISIDTRAQAQNAQLTAGQEVLIWAKHTGTDNDYLRAWSLTADGSGNLNPTTDNDWRYYPADGTNVDLYALHGNIIDPATITTSTTPNASLSDDATDGTELPTTVTHAILATQNNIDDYSNSDLFAVKAINVGPYLNSNLGNNYSVNLPFQHQLARVVVRIVNFNDLLPDDIEDIVILNVKTTTTLTLPNHESSDRYTGVGGETQETVVDSLFLHPIDDDAPARIRSAECIMPAQTFSFTALKPTFICVKLKHNSSAINETNDKLYYKPGALTFNIENRKVYRFDLTISKVEMTGFKIDWADWGWVNPDELGEDAWLPYYTKEEMDQSEADFSDFGNETNNDLKWEYGDGDNTNEKEKGNGWL